MKPSECMGCKYFKWQYFEAECFGADAISSCTYPSGQDFLYKIKECPKVWVQAAVKDLDKFEWMQGFYLRWDNLVEHGESGTVKS